MNESSTTKDDLPLAGLRVIDAAPRTAPHCGQLLALFGAEVIAFDVAAPDDTVPSAPDWVAFNLGKRISRSPDGLDALVAHGDVLIEGDAPRLGYRPTDANERLIHTIITPFGTTGPRSDWQSTELIAQAAGGILHLSGSAAFPPARLGFSLARSMAGAQAAGAVMFALAQRGHTGRGTTIDVSQQESVANLLFTTQFMAHVQSETGERGEMPYTLSDERLTRKVLWRCKDGNVTWTLWTGPGMGPKNISTFEWMKERGIPEADRLLEIPWEQMSTSDITREILETVNRAVGGFFETLTKDEIKRVALERRILLYSVDGPADVLANAQLRARDAFRWLALPDGKRAEVVATPMRSSAYRLEFDCENPLPTVDTQTVERQWATARRQTPVAAAEQRLPTQTSSALPLAGIRVLDFAWAIVGPLTTKYLAMFGAEVVKLEYRKRPDPTRMTGPYPLGRPAMDGSAMFISVNASKRSMGIDLTKPEANALIRRLAARADIATENFAPGVLSRLGYGYDVLREIKPDLIMLSLSMQGQTGPCAEQPGLGNHLQAMSGIDYLTGFPDGPPGGPNQVMPDYIGPWSAIVAVLAALEHRRLTGEGQYLDVAQLEAMFMYLQPQLIELQTAAVPPQRIGNASPMWAPHGVYPVAGDDRWMALAVRTDDEWQRLHAKLPAETQALFGAAMPTATRLEQRVPLDAAISAFTAGFDGESLMRDLQALGLAAYTVNDGRQMVADPQLAFRGHYRKVEHPKLGQQLIDVASYRFDNLEPRVEPGPLYSEGSADVLTEWLGIEPDELSDLIAEGVVDF